MRALGINNNKITLLILLLLLALISAAFLMKFTRKEQEETTAPSLQSSVEQRHLSFLLNVPKEKFVTSLGEPRYTRQEGRNLMVRYQTRDCVMSVYFKQARQNKTASKKILFHLRSNLQYDKLCEKEFNLAAFK